MGIIAYLKNGYKYLYLYNLLDIFDQEGGYDLAAERGKHQKRGCIGVHFGDKPHILDYMEMLKKVWKGKDGNASLPEKAMTLSKADTLEFCHLMADVKLKADA
eukprot:6653286-Ditylum_brightwellii.AAC.1